MLTAVQPRHLEADSYCSAGPTPALDRPGTPPSGLAVAVAAVHTCAAAPGRDPVLLKGHLKGEGAREPRLRARPVTERTRRYLANFNLKVPRWTCQIPRPPPGDGTFGANVGTPPPPYVGTSAWPPTSLCGVEWGARSPDCSAAVYRQSPWCDNGQRQTPVAVLLSIIPV